MTAHRISVASTFLLALVAFGTAPAAQQGGPDADLTREIAAQDAALFDAFNAYDLETVGRYFSEDLEFYHDQDGLLSRGQVMEGTASLFAADNGLRRNLVAGTLEVFPVAGYGAIQRGRHRFCHNENGRDDCGTFEFVHVWRQTNDGWQLTRVLSYGH